MKVETVHRTFYVVQSCPNDLLEHPERLWADEETADSRIVAYAALGKHRDHGAPGHAFRLVKRTITERMEVDWNNNE